MLQKYCTWNQLSLLTGMVTLDQSKPLLAHFNTFPGSPSRFRTPKCMMGIRNAKESCPTIFQTLATYAANINPSRLHCIH